MCKKLFSAKKLEAAAALTLVFACVVSTVSFDRRCEEVRENVLRLHVIANSDTDVDQSIKLKVRDAVLENGKEIFDGSVTAEDAAQRLAPYTSELEKTADRVLAENGADYTARIVIGDEYFNTRTYEDVTLPAGRYTAVRVILGEGEGKNWWCVMFPPMCLPAAEKQTELDAVLSEDGVKIVKSSPRYEIRFKAVEIFEKIRSYFN
ncbi:MAG: stage II sporulation protein R [Clostridiales bacterium]|nr:stage II sporulation protein R [Clostridiales bacterium]